MLAVPRIMRANLFSIDAMMQNVFHVTTLALVLLHVTTRTKIAEITRNHEQPVNFTTGAYATMRCATVQLMSVR